MRNGQNGRRRGRGGGNGGGGGGTPGIVRVPGPRPDMGNRNEVRVRGNAAQMLEKYRQLARDVGQAGDRVAAEYYMQYADHYYRVVNEFRQRENEQRPPQQQGQPQQQYRQNGQREEYDDQNDDDGYDAPEPLRVSDMTVTHAAPQGMPPAIRAEPVEASPERSDDDGDNNGNRESASADSEEAEAPRPRRRGRPRRQPDESRDTVDA